MANNFNNKLCFQYGENFIEELHESDNFLAKNGTIYFDSAKRQIILGQDNDNGQGKNYKIYSDLYQTLFYAEASFNATIEAWIIKIYVADLTNKFLHDSMTALRIYFKDDMELGKSKSCILITASDFPEDTPTDTSVIINKGISVTIHTENLTWAANSFLDFMYLPNPDKITNGQVGQLELLKTNTAINIQGNAATATKLKTGRTLQVNLGLASASTAFDGSGNINDIGVSGILPVAYGGTGVSSFTANRIIISNTTTSGTLKTLGAGTSGQYLKSNGSNAPSWTSFLKPTATWSSETTAGPKLTITTDGGSSAAAEIPVASTTQSGVITTGNQELAGRKTIKLINPKIYDGTTATSRYHYLYFYNNANTQLGYIMYDSGNYQNVLSGQFYFRQFSPKTTPDTGVSDFYESYSLPIIDEALTTNKNYNILTTKNKITIAQGGTGQSTALASITALGGPSIASEGTSLISLNIDNLTSYGTYYSGERAVTAELSGTQPYDTGYKLYNIHNYGSNYDFQYALGPSHNENIIALKIRQKYKPDNEDANWGQWQQVAFIKDIPINYYNSTDTRAKNTVLAGPTTGADAVATFRSLVAADIPSLDVSKITTGYFSIARGGTGTNTAVGHRLVWTNDGGTSYVTESSNYGHYADGNFIAVNSRSKPSTNFYVNGTSSFNGTVTGTKFIGPLEGNATSATALTRRTSYDKNENNVSKTAINQSPTNGYLELHSAILNSTAGLFPHQHGSTNSSTNAILTIKRYTNDNYNSQLGFSADGNIYYRSFFNTELDITTSWKQIAFTDTTVNTANTANKVQCALTFGDENDPIATYDGSEAVNIPIYKGEIQQ